MSPDDGDGGDSDPSNPQTWNLYSYVDNNPLNSIDPDGHDVEVCTTNSDGSDQCGEMSNKQYQNASEQDNGGLSVPGLGEVQQQGTSWITNPQGYSVGSATYVSNNPGFDAYVGNNAQGYQMLDAANTTVNYATAGAIAVYGGAAFAPEIVTGAGTAFETGRSLYYAAAGILPAVPSAVEKLQRLGISLSEANEILDNPSTQRFVDNANGGNINHFLNVGGKIIRITTDPAGRRIISAGIVQARNIANGIATGRFTK